MSTSSLLSILLLWIVAGSCHAFTASVARTATAVGYSQLPTKLGSSFFGDFEEFENKDDDEDEDEEDDDEFEDLDAKSVAAFRSKMGNMFGGNDTSEEGEGVSSVDELIKYARSQGETTEQPVTEWANLAESIKPGIILVANPAKFCSTGTGILSTGPSPSLLAKFGLTRPPPKDLGPDRQADLLPVLALVERDDKKGCRGVLLNRRTGYLLGDLEQPPPALGEQAADLPPILEKFCIQPLWFGGIDNISSGLDMLHQCPAVGGADRLTEDGLFWGGDPAQAQDAMEDPSLDRIMTGFDFKFFVQSTIWSTKDLDREIKEGIWVPADVSKGVLFKSRDRMGTQKAKPLWTEIMELMGGDYQQIKDQFYEDEP
jgi:hypothetical protein